MSPKMDNPPVTERKTATYKGFLMKTPDMWLKNKRLTDGAEGLWRIHDNLYDVSDFVAKHPGGPFWLESTKGTDITEAFESHHILSLVPEETLKKYFVRNAKTPRVSPYTFEDDGFYRTLKKRVRDVLKTVPMEDSKISNMYADSLITATFVLAVLSCALWSYKIVVLAGICCGLTVTTSHNYIHQRDNFRMHYADVFMVQCRALRIIHVISHHFTPNTVADVQVYFTEPVLKYFPEKKPFLIKYGSWIYGPLLVWPTTFQALMLLTVLGWIFDKDSGKLGKTDLLQLMLPITMYILGGQPLLATLGMWQLVILVGGFCFSVFGFAGGHAHPEVFIEGDTPRPKEEMDWGINQLDTVSDRVEVTGSKFLVLVTFGDHALHHLFPTLDHSVLHHLYPVVQDVMKQFSVDIRMTTQADMIFGYFRQLAKEKGNPDPPNLLKKEK